ncbi:nickel insertion protein [Blautia sp. Marseille-P3201T]|uniref:nickel insertion protein n=1 Tax=Blautia sp. Marseille-P3201T TaxID=1907659 RepID=UPI000930CBCF|nr:nickel insertion protein [Blautia sp. Marseille-P3201T]
MGNRLYMTCKNGLNCNALIQALTKLVNRQNLFVKEKLNEETKQRLAKVYALLEEAGEDWEEDRKQQEELGRLLDTLECEKICFSSLPEGNNEETLEEKSVSVFRILQKYHIPIELQPQKGELLSLGTVCFLAVFGEWGTEKTLDCIVQTVIEKADRDIMVKLLLCSDKENLEKTKDTVQVLETNVDDCSGEQLGYAIECLMKAGALDASCFPIYMKKNRVAYMLQVLCKKERQEALEDIIFRETTSIGLRRYEERRRILPRTFKEILLKDGHTVTVKVCEHHGQKFCYPEFETVKKVCEETGRAYRDVYDEASAAAGGYYENL